MFSRRQILQNAAAGFGYIAFAGISTRAAEESKTLNPLAPKAPHFPARAKRVIFLCMQGGPSHVDTFDYKPQLNRDHGKRGKYGGSLLKSPWAFRQRGKSGLWISDLFPNVAEHADDLTLIRSMQCDQPVHPGAMTQMHTGTAQFIRPSLGAWTLYGLGTENDSLPGFISLSPPSGSSRNYGSAFLPAIYGGAKVGRGGRASRFARGGTGESVPDIKNPGQTKKQQRSQLDFIQALNREKLRRDKNQPGVEGVIESYELAFRMQDAMPALMDTSKETQSTLEMYGADAGTTENFGKQCLLARRFIEAGVRFVEVAFNLNFINGTGWDTHNQGQLNQHILIDQLDQALSTLINDLEKRKRLDKTLIVVATEFGRPPEFDGGGGRGHHSKAFSVVLAGGGLQLGKVIGVTDELGREVVERPVSVPDLHATIYHAMSVDPAKELYDGDRPVPITDRGTPVAELFG